MTWLLRLWPDVKDACHKLEKEQIFGELWKAVRTNEETEEDSTTLKNNKTALILSLIGTEFALACNRPNNEEMKLSELLWLTTLPRNLFTDTVTTLQWQPPKQICGADTHLCHFSIAQFQHFSPLFTSTHLGLGCFPNKIVSHLNVGGVVGARWPESPLTSCR